MGKRHAPEPNSTDPADNNQQEEQEQITNKTGDMKTDQPRTQNNTQQHPKIQKTKQQQSPMKKALQITMTSHGVEQAR